MPILTANILDADKPDVVGVIQAKGTFQVCHQEKNNQTNQQHYHHSLGWWLSWKNAREAPKFRPLAHI